MNRMPRMAARLRLMRMLTGNRPILAFRIITTRRIMWLRQRPSTSGSIPAVIAIIGSMMVMGCVAVATGSGVAVTESGAMGSGVAVTDCKGGRFAATMMEEPERSAGQETALKQARKGH